MNCYNFNEIEYDFCLRLIYFKQGKHLGNSTYLLLPKLFLY